MNFLFPVRFLILAGLIALIISGCLVHGEPMTESDNDITRYELALASHPGSSEGIERGLAAFESGFGDLTSPDLATRINALYAPSMYFNDTLHVFQKRDELVDYLTRTGASLSESRVEIRQVVTDGADVFVRWQMTFKTRAAGKEIHSDSIGMTHLRFDPEGRVVLHQDFWDSGHGLYAHLPVVGFLIRRARARL
jgi:hypothetical protein